MLPWACYRSRMFRCTSQARPTEGPPGRASHSGRVRCSVVPELISKLAVAVAGYRAWSHYRALKGARTLLGLFNAQELQLSSSSAPAAAAAAHAESSADHTMGQVLCGPHSKLPSSFLAVEAVEETYTGSGPEAQIWMQCVQAVEPSLHRPQVVGVEADERLDPAAEAISR